VGVQNVAAAEKGAQTGEVKAEQVKDFGVHWAIVGHSERRNIFKETDEIVAQKIQRCQEQGMHAIVCIGEQLEERESGHTHDVLKV
jgi:triosephosphate isomerase